MFSQKAIETIHPLSHCEKERRSNPSFLFAASIKQL